MNLKILAIDSSSSVASVAIVDENKLICEYILNHKKTHSQKLMPMLDEVLKNCEIKIDDVDLFAYANGPGSFTGLRIGASTIKALAHGLNKPVIELNTLEIMAYNLPFCEYDIAPIMDARRNEVYNGIYAWENAEFIEFEAPRAVHISTIIDEIRNRNKKTVFVGDGVLVHKKTLIDELGSLCIISPQHTLMQRASSIATLAYNRLEAKKSYKDVGILYLRKSQAEREYDEKEKKTLC